MEVAIGEAMMTRAPSLRRGIGSSNARVIIGEMVAEAYNGRIWDVLTRLAL